MSGEEIRDRWATVVQRILDEHCAGNKSAFARRVVIDGRAINPRTVYAWLRGDMDVRESSVRAVAEGFELNPLELLVEVGVYTPEQRARASAQEFDEERRLVLDSKELDNSQKAFILQEIDRMEAEDEAAIEQLRAKDRRRRAERVAALMQQRRSA
jgi:hypothetical protein